MKKLIILGNGCDWCDKSLVKLKQYEGVKFINSYLPTDSSLAKTFGKVQFAFSTNRKIKIPLKKLWYKSFLKKMGIYQNYKDEICILIYDHNVLGNEFDFFQYIRKNYPNIKIAYIFTNIVKYSGAMENDYVHMLNNAYDVVFAFDLEDAKKYGFNYSPLIYDPDEECFQNKERNSVFYVGQAKDRLEKILEVYERLKVLGVDSDFHISKVKESDIKYPGEIEYNKFLTYENCVERIKASSVLLDVIQGDSVGLTIKVCEAVAYNKKLITSNVHVKNCPFYDPNMIHVLDDEEDLEVSFFDSSASYKEDSIKFFSADTFWEKLWSSLK